MARRPFFEITAEDERYQWRDEDRLGTFFSSDVFDASRLPNREQCEIISVFIQSHLDEQHLSRVPNLKLIATRSTGFNHIDLAYCKSRGITVSNVPVYGDNTVAEHTFALILALSRKDIQSYDRARSANFSLAGLRGFDLRGKTLGVVGTGHIGIHVIRIAHGFMMNVVAFDSPPDKRLADALDFIYVDSLDSLLAASDIVTLHAPMAPATHTMINAQTIQRMKRGATEAW